MTDKDASIFTQERVLTISGYVSQARLCTQLIIQKMLEDDVAATYANRGTRYYASASGVPGVRSIRAPRADESKPPAPSTETVITMTVSDTVIGSIIGKNGATLREMSTLSGAKIAISPREDSKDGQRTITISGEAAAAQNAHAFCTEKIRQGGLAKTRVRKEKDEE
jgi:RNA-binding protein Nova